jgi:phytoene synthase
MHSTTALRVPHQPARNGGAAGDLAACRESLRNGSKTFLAASKLLPRSVRDPACALYAFCRMADDVVDQNTVSPGEGVAELRERLDAVYRGSPFDQAPDRALAEVVRTHELPRELLDALLEGFEWDAQGRRYETLDDLYAYAARVAGTVGAMMAVLMGARSRQALARACDLGVAMQLSNIARDVGEDARNGRLYLPLAWLGEAGIEPASFLAAPRFSPALGGVVERLLDAADVLYARVAAGVAELPPNCRPGIDAARFLYAEIGHEVVRRGLDSVSSRAVVSRRRKALGLLQALTCIHGGGRAQEVPPLPQTRFLVEAAARPGAAGSRGQRPGGMVRFIELVEQFEQRRLGIGSDA